MVAGGRYDPMDTMGHLRLREKVLRGIAGNGGDLNFVKTHNARTRAFGVELILPRYTRAAVYIIRDPLDVAVSYARHYGMTPAEAAQAISRPDNTTSADADQRQAVSRQLVRPCDRLDRRARLPRARHALRGHEGGPARAPSRICSAFSASPSTPSGSTAPSAFPPSTR